MTVKGWVWGYGGMEIRGGYRGGGGGMCMRVWKWGVEVWGRGSLASFLGHSQLYGPYHLHTMLSGMDHM